MIKPTIGRVLWFWPSLEVQQGFVVLHPEQACVAQIAYVWADDLINISANDHRGIQKAFTSVPLIQPGQSKPASGFCCEWMPFQVGQAAAQSSVAGRLENAGVKSISGCNIEVDEKREIDISGISS